MTPPGHVPQLIVPPHPSGSVPQLSGAGHIVNGVHPHVPALQVSGGLHVLPAQQGCPGPPQAAHVPPTQTSPVLHVFPMQHTCPEPPHITPPLQMSSWLGVIDLRHVLPAAH